MWTAKDRARRLQIDLATHPAGSRPTLRMVINASCASKAASTLTVEKRDIVISASAEIYDNMLLSCVTADWCSAARILAAAMTRSLNDSGRRAGDLVLFGRLRKLIDAGKLDARGDLATLRGSEVRLSSR